ncbi:MULTISPECIES: hypothetical protein [unclassified Stenotrophomonas]|uniref:hypothetical protein n=1 Tax=unclassified Stenotrophomonas TaxID=196198 RepID=UPI003BF8522C
MEGSGWARGFGSVFPLQSDYFTLFAKNADQLGLVDERTATLVIQGYIDLKGSVDSFLCNNRLLEEFEQARLKLGASTDSSWVVEHIESIEDQLRRYGPPLIQNYDKAVASVGAALKSLKT